MSGLESLRHILARLLAVWRTRGPLEFATFVLTRIVLRREDLIFECSLGEIQGAPFVLPERGRFVIVDGAGIALPEHASVVAQVLQGENGVHVSGLLDGDLMLAHVGDTGVVDNYAFVLFRTGYKRFLGLEDAVPLIGNCNTLAEARGRGLYPLMLRYICCVLAGRGYGRVVITCAPSNKASIRGIEKAGFEFVSHLTCWIVLSRVVVWRGGAK
ncbi:MAG: GNAT family protein [Burkholderiaceae bacterium]